MEFFIFHLPDVGMCRRTIFAQLKNWATAFRFDEIELATPSGILEINDQIVEQDLQY